MKKTAKRNKRLGIVLLVLYGISLLWLLLGQRIRLGAKPDYSVPLENRMNLEPFATVKLYLNLIRTSKSPYLQMHSWVNLLGNVALFVPMGYLLPKTFSPMRNFLKLVFWVTITMIFVEILQLVTCLGSLDVDDLILNIAGVIIGYFIWVFKTK